MNSIGEKEYSACYAQAKLVFENKRSKKAAIDFLSDKNGLGMKKSSATYYVNAYLKMRQGEKYTKTINNEATIYYLQHIQSDNGMDALKTALDALKKHLDYYSKQRKGNLQFLQELHDLFSKKF